MKIIFFGATKFSEAMLFHLLSNKFKVEAIFTIPEEFHISYSNEKVKNYNYADLNLIANEHDIKLYEVDSVADKKINDYYEIIKEIAPDIILVLGWYYMVPKKIREIAKFGAWGIHASLLPKYAGGAPLVWAIINGEKEAGVTLFKLDDGVDDGDIIAQRSFPIEFQDTIKEIYEKAIEASQTILIEALNNVDRIEFKLQDKSKIEIYPQRKPEDGKIDLTKTAIENYNFIRAQTRPYPGAYTTIDEEKIHIWKALLLHPDFIDRSNLALGEIVFLNDNAAVNFKNGLLRILQVFYSNNDWKFEELVAKKCWQGKIIDT
jgi:methionyl-tRNA formyltransferase